MVTVANLNQPAPPLNDIVVELSVPISFGVSVISAESALPFTLRAEGTRPFALSLAAFTAFGVAASVSDALLVALLSWTIPFLCCRSVLSSIFPVSKVIGCLYRLWRCRQHFRCAVGRVAKLNYPFLCCRCILCGVFPVSQLIRGLNGFLALPPVTRKCCWSRCLAGLSPFFVVLASSSATADAISSARFAAVSARVAADSAVLFALSCRRRTASCLCRLRGCRRGAALCC